MELALILVLSVLFIAQSYLIWGMDKKMNDLVNLAAVLTTDAANVKVKLDSLKAAAESAATQIADLTAQVAAGTVVDPALIAQFQAVHDSLVAELAS